MNVDARGLSRTRPMSAACQHAVPLRSRVSLRRLRRRMSQYKHGSFEHRVLTADAGAAPQAEPFARACASAVNQVRVSEACIVRRRETQLHVVDAAYLALFLRP